MSATIFTPAGRSRAIGPDLRWLRSDPAYQSVNLLRVGFAVLPVAMGVDKFFNVLVNWEKYLAPWIHHLSPLSATRTMHVVGVVETLAGVAVALKPRYGACIVATWLGGIIINLLSYSGYYDVALRDFGLMLGALTLARLASKYDPPGPTNIGTWRHTRAGAKTMSTTRYTNGRCPSDEPASRTTRNCRSGLGRRSLVARGAEAGCEDCDLCAARVGA
jgi:uncharacterized membrane protein YphA (DoxX/SURF4 family)